MALLLPVLLLGAVEVGLRLADYGFDPHFFKPFTINGTDYFVQNDDFSRLFFPAETARTSGPIRLPARKPPGTFRIFILGESAAMGDPEPAYGAGRYLEMLLRAKYPSTKFEVVNVAFTAINSHVILPIARECAQQDGDLWIVYMGNNEMVGPFGAATVFGRQAPPLPYVRLVTALRRTRTGQLIENWAHRMRQDAPAAAWGGMQMFLQNEIPPDSPLKETVYRNFAKNLDEIVRAGTDSGARVLLNTVAVNLRECPPFATVGETNVPATEALLASAAQRDPQSAALQYAWGQSLLAQGNLPAAQAHLQAAADADALPFRADSRINALIRAEREKLPAGKLILLDAAAVLATNQPGGLCGLETFYEHVHFDFPGSYRLARAWADQVAALLPANADAWATPAACDDRLGLSDWNREVILQHMAGRMQVPPFSTQASNAPRMANLLGRASALHQRLNPAAAAATQANFEKQLAAAPDDWLLHENFALFLQVTGHPESAIAEWRKVHDLIPQDYLAYFQIGRLLGARSPGSEAEDALRQALRLRPGLTEGWLELGNVLAARDEVGAALTAYDTARQQHPQDGQILVRRGKLLAKASRHAEAVADFRAASQLNPADWEAHFELGGELDAAGQFAAAITEFGAAARLHPEYSRTHFNYGVVLAKQHQFTAAEVEFTETLRLEPDNATAQKYLAAVQRLKTQEP